MKATFFVTLIAGFVASSTAFDHAQKRAQRPQEAYKGEVVEPTLKLDTVNLKQLPETVASLTPRAANDFYECRNTVSIPSFWSYFSLLSQVLSFP